ncbi:MAG: anthranilate phosphoribosyltransferase [Rhodobiaceae bacterium]|jgi:anthranilate phosphoribosyltransferase|nr:anthranilate phosphoribosyltransferase [Rhodobiaceae bacterium]MDG2495084.1 anthranilate phosphoribosyltransferase [Alphaproteobacteria bacterium]
MDALKPTLAILQTGRPLTSSEASTAFEVILSGEASPAQIGSFVTALRVRGETIDEIAAGVSVMRANAMKVKTPTHVLDTCGTGGDGSGSYNISTAVALVAAACGAYVAKHGTLAQSSKSGSSDVLQALGVELNLSANALAQCINDVGIGFLFAPNHHATMRHVAPIRKELGFRTIFNLLGPLSNPAGANRQLLGVFDKQWVEPLAQVLKKLGSERAWVVHGSDGMDELTTTGPSTVASLRKGEVNVFEVTPEDAGLTRAKPEDLVGGTPSENAAAMTALLDGEAGAYRDIVLFNAAAALVVCHKAETLKEGVEMAALAIDDGGAKSVLANLVATSQKLAD